MLSVYIDIRISIERVVSTTKKQNANADMSTNTRTNTSTDSILILGAVARSHFLWWVYLWTAGDLCAGSSVESHLEGLFFFLIITLLPLYIFLPLYILRSFLLLIMSL